MKLLNQQQQYDDDDDMMMITNTYYSSNRKSCGLKRRLLYNMLKAGLQLMIMARRLALNRRPLPWCTCNTLVASISCSIKRRLLHIMLKGRHATTYCGKKEGVLLKRKQYE
jgi:hypothetical protein